MYDNHKNEMKIIKYYIYKMQVPTYPTLYKRGNAKGKILQWSLNIVQNTKGDGYDIITLYGEQNGTLIEKVANIPIGKAGRTVIQQVTQEANRRFQNKKEKENYSETINNDTIIEMRPMLAQTFSFELYKKVSRSYKMSFPLFVQPKLDGIRCISHFMVGSPIKMISRKGTSFINFKNIEQELYIKMNNKIESNVFIDGELYSNELTFEKISGLVRSQTLTKDEIQEIKKIQYHIYDIFLPQHPLLNYKQRFDILSTLFNNDDSSHICKLVNTETANSIDDIQPFHAKYVEQGYEGIMLRDKNGIYEIDKRSKYLQKYKTFIEEEFPIIGYTNEDGMIIFQCNTTENKTFSVRPRGTFETRREMFAKGDSYIGKLLTVIFQEYTELNIPRFPVGKTIRDYE